MNKYIFILGQSSDLARQELISFLAKDDKIEHLSNNFAIVSTNNTADKMIKNLGGTIKIAKYQESLDKISQLDEKKWLDFLSKNLDDKKKNYFGFSLYNNKNSYKDINRLGMSLKQTIKNKGFKIRFVTSRENALSSVIVSKNNLLGKELIVIFGKEKIYLGLTEAVQDFESYGKRDAYRPNTDSMSGMLPPKVAQMMINISQAKNNSVLLDPFCGSGTIIQEAALMSIKKIYGSDNSQTAVDDSKKNIAWLREKYKINSEITINKIDARHLAQNLKNINIDTIVSEPYMGNARLIQKTNNVRNIEQIKDELQNLYLETFRQFYKILKENGKIVFIFPIFQIGRDSIYTLNEKNIANVGFKAIKPAEELHSHDLSKNGNIIYMRPGQKVLREITIWEK